MRGALEMILQCALAFGAALLAVACTGRDTSRMRKLLRRLSRQTKLLTEEVKDLSGRIGAMEGNMAKEDKTDNDEKLKQQEETIYEL